MFQVKIPLSWLRSFGYTNRQLIYAAARYNLGEMLAPENRDLGCVISVNHVVANATGTAVCNGASTKDAVGSLVRDSWRWSEVSRSQAGAGDIEVVETGTGNGKIYHGHIGVLSGLASDPKTLVLSNNSSTGKFDDHISQAAWDEYFGKRGGFKSRFFRIKN